MSNDDENESGALPPFQTRFPRPLVPREYITFRGIDFSRDPEYLSPAPTNPEPLNLTPEGIREHQENKNEIQIRINDAYYRGFETAKNQYEYSSRLTIAQLRHLATIIHEMPIFTDSEKTKFAQLLALGLGIDEDTIVKLCNKNK